MKCPFCGDQESKVVDSRHSEDGLSIRRRRECLVCQRRFTTYEIVESLPIIVVKRDGSRQAFDRNKILQSMVRAFDKRQVETSVLDRITTEIEQTIQNSLEREVSTDRIGEMVMERIKPIDEVAYIRFASVYRRFQDVRSFNHDIKTFQDKKKGQTDKWIPLLPYLKILILLPLFLSWTRLWASWSWWCGSL